MQEKTLEVETNQRERIKAGNKDKEKFKRWVIVYLQLSAW